MNTTFAQAVANQTTTTANGMKAFENTSDACVDFFFAVGASRGKDIIPAFVAALAQARDLALRIALWSRDVRGGAGERKIFRDILQFLEKHDVEAAKSLLVKTPELGRWDDIFVFSSSEMKNAAYTILGDALRSGDKLAAKWAPREKSAQSHIAKEIRTFFGMTPKAYRRTLANLSSTVEDQMCSNDWDNINFSHVPSVASARYKSAFNRHTPKFAEYVAALVKGDPSVKVTAGAVFPYDVLKGVSGYYDYDQTENNHIIAQWEALPNFVGDANILPLVDVSGSMSCPAGGYDSKSQVTCMDVAISLGLYLAEKNTGKFKDTFLTFTGSPKLMTLRGNVLQKYEQMKSSEWGMNTNLHAAMDKILEVALTNNVAQAEMPEMLLVLSDMQFDRCISNNDSAMEMIERKFTNAGYRVPKIVFWNLNASDNVPVKADKSGAALVSGFSPALVKAILSANMSEFTPRNIMLKTIMSERYDF